MHNCKLSVRNGYEASETPLHHSQSRYPQMGMGKMGIVVKLSSSGPPAQLDIEHNNGSVKFRVCFIHLLIGKLPKAVDQKYFTGIYCH